MPGWLRNPARLAKPPPDQRSLQPPPVTRVRFQDNLLLRVVALWQH
jgi:hypothetical protein